MKRPRQTAIAEITPDIRPNILYSSFGIGFILMLFLCSKPLQDFRIDAFHNALTDFLTSTILDEALIQSLSLVLLVFLTTHYFSRITHKPFSKLVLIFFAFYFFIMVFSFVIEGFFLKPTFRYTHPDTLLSDSHLAAWFTSWLKLNVGQDTAAPSGYAFRQTIILLFFLLLSHQLPWRTVISHSLSRYLHWLFYSCFVIVFLLRVYRGRHTFFDVGVGIGVGVMSFWIFALCTVFFVKRTHIHKRLLGDSVAPLISYSIALLFYCQETNRWIIAIITTFVVMGLLHHITPDPATTFDHDAH